MRDGTHNGRQSWWWTTNGEAGLGATDWGHGSGPAGDEPARPATPPPEVRSTLPGAIRRPRQGEPVTAQPGAEPSSAAALHVLLVERDIAVRDKLVAVLLEQGCDVNAFRTPKRAEIHAIYWGYDVLIARPEILEQTSHWQVMVPGRRPLGTLAIAASRDADQRLRARVAGARGVLAPPFQGPVIGQTLTEALSLLIAERAREKLGSR